MGTSARLRIDVPAGANTLVVTIEIPPYAATPHGTSLAATFDGVAVPATCCLDVGVTQAAFSIPHVSSHDRAMIVTLASSSHFVPARLHLNDDRRTLSVLLMAVAVEDTLTGTVYGTTPSAPVQDPAERIALVAFLIVCGIATFVLVRRRTASAWAILILTDPFALAVPVGPTTLTLPKVALLGAILALAVQRVPLRPLRDARFWALGGALVLFVASMALSSVRATYHGAALRETLKAVEYLLLFGVGVLAYGLDPDLPLLRAVLSWITILVSATAIAQFWYGSTESIYLAGHTLARVGGALEGPNQLGAFLGIVLPLTLSLSIGTRVRAENVLALALGAVALLMTFSRAGVVACAAACILVLVLRIRARGVVLAVVTVAWLAIGAMAFDHAVTGGGAFSKIFPARATDAYNGGLGTRPELWHGAIAMWRAHPLLGVGPGNYELEIAAFAPGVRTHANNYYLQALSEQGLVGLLLFLLVLVTTVIVLYDQPDALRAGVLAIVIALAFHQLVDGLLLYPKVGDVYWLLVGIAAIPSKTQYTSPTLG